MAIQAVLFDLGHTLVDYEVESGALLASYADVHAYLARLGLGSQPVDDDLMLRVSTRALDLIVASYERGEIEELDMLTLFDEALRHHGWSLEPELVWELLRREHAAFAGHLRVPPATLDALAELRKALAIVRVYGDDHPDVGEVRHAIAVMLGRLGRTDEAIAEFDAAERILRAARGDRHLEVAAVLQARAAFLQDIHLLDAAIDYYRRALAIQEAGLGAEWVRAPRLPLVGEERERILGIIRRGLETRPKIPPRTRSR